MKFFPSKKKLRGEQSERQLQFTVIILTATEPTERQMQIGCKIKVNKITNEANFHV